MIHKHLELDKYSYITGILVLQRLCSGIFDAIHYRYFMMKSTMTLALVHCSIEADQGERYGVCPGKGKGKLGKLGGKKL